MDLSSICFLYAVALRVKCVCLCVCVCWTSASQLQVGVNWLIAGSLPALVAGGEASTSGSGSLHVKCSCPDTAKQTPAKEPSARPMFPALHLSIRIDNRHDNHLPCFRTIGRELFVLDCWQHLAHGCLTANLTVLAAVK